MNEECIFCKFAKGDENNIWENDFFFSFYDSYPVTPGHALIVPKKHIIDISSLEKSEWLELQNGIKEVISILEKTDFEEVYQKMIDNSISDLSVWFCKKALDNPRINTKPDAYNHGVNDGRSAGRTVDHLHWHIIPRYEGDMEDPRGGVRYVIPEMGNYKIPRN